MRLLQATSLKIIYHALQLLVVLVKPLSASADESYYVCCMYLCNVVTLQDGKTLSKILMLLLCCGLDKKKELCCKQQLYLMLLGPITTSDPGQNIPHTHATLAFTQTFIQFYAFPFLQKLFVSEGVPLVKMKNEIIYYIFSKFLYQLCS